MEKSHSLLNNLWAVAPGLGFPFGQSQPGWFCGDGSSIGGGKPLGDFFHQWRGGRRVRDLHWVRVEGKGERHESEPHFAVPYNGIQQGKLRDTGHLR